MLNPEPVTTSRRPWIVAAIWGLMLVGVVAVGIGLSRPGTASGADAPGAAITTASNPSASPEPAGSPGPGWAGPGDGGPGNGGMMGMGGRFGAGPMMRAGPDKGGHGIGVISITKIDGTRISLATADGWTRAIDASGAAIQREGQAITVADLKVGDQIAFREKRNADGTFTVTDIAILPAHVAGAVTGTTADSITVKALDGTSITVRVDGSTTYMIPGVTSPTLADVADGAWLMAIGQANPDGSISATRIGVMPAGQPGAGPNGKPDRPFGGGFQGGQNGPWGGPNGKMPHRGGMGAPPNPAPSASPTGSSTSG